jgi:hypothetical protein
MSGSLRSSGVRPSAPPLLFNKPTTNNSQAQSIPIVGVTPGVRVGRDVSTAAIAAEREAVEGAPRRVAVVARRHPELEEEEEGVPFQVARAAAERHPASALGSLASGRRRLSVPRPRARRRWTRPILGR